MGGKNDRGFNDFGLDDLTSAVAPTPVKAPTRTESEAIKATAAPTGFTSREPRMPIQRRRRSPYTEFFSQRATPEALAKFRQIVDGEGWSGVEALDEAIKALAEKYGYADKT